MATEYGGRPDEYSNAATATLLDLVGSVEGLNVLDLACGHGTVTRELARRGARVIGGDISIKLLDHARAIEATDPLGIEYIQLDAGSAEPLEDSQFNLLVANFGLSDIDDLPGACATVSRVLKSGGSFVFSILHPYFGGGEGVSASWPTDTGYFDERWWRAEGELSTLRAQVGSNHRTLSTYLNTLIQHDLVPEELREPAPERELVERSPVLASLPIYLVGRCRTRSAHIAAH